MKCFPTLIILLFLITGCSSDKGIPNSPTINAHLQDSSGLELNRLKLPEGFTISLYARVDNARSMAMSPNGTLFVGNRDGNKVYALQDLNDDFKADTLYTLAEGLRMPSGVAFKDGTLYVAEVSKLWKFPAIESTLSAPNKELVYDDYPEDAHHGWKYIAFGPDGKLYIPVGAPCNICESKNEIYASITRMNPDGSDREIYVHGVRNSVGFTWHPQTGNMYFTDNGRDLLGDSIPPCELNRVTEAGQHFGYPYCHGGYLQDPELGDRHSCDEFIAPAQKLGPHVAPLGIKFYTGNMFPQTYQGLAFIAEHGSWNRTPDAGHTGHKITTVKIEDGKGIAYEDFITGFLNKETNKAWGRPVDVLILEDGSMLISDDRSGSIYRVSYAG